MDQLKWRKAATGMTIDIIDFIVIIIRSSLITFILLIIVTLSWVLVARKQVRTELDEVSPHRAPSIALVGEGDAASPGPVRF